MFGSCVAPTQPVTELEQEIAAVLEGSENVKEAEGEGEGLSEAEQEALLRMSLEEVCACLVCPLHSHCNPLSLSLPPSLPPSPSLFPSLPPSLPPLPPSPPPSLSSGPRTSPRAAAIPGPHVLLRAEGAQNWQNQEQVRGIECRMNAVRVCLCGPIRVLTLVYIPRTTCTCTLVLAIYIASFPVSTPRLFFCTLHFPLCKKKLGSGDWERG